MIDALNPGRSSLHHPSLADMDNNSLISETHSPVTSHLGVILMGMQTILWYVPNLTGGGMTEPVLVRHQAPITAW